MARGTRQGLKRLLRRIARRARPVTVDQLAATTSIFWPTATRSWYAPVLLGPESVAEVATEQETLREVVSTLRLLERDDYSDYLLEYYQAGLEKFGANWRYTDICSVLYSLGKLLQPSSYLEIGVRRGRSMAMVARTAPNCSLIGFDLWTPNYSGMPNPGPDFVRAEMHKIGHTGALTLISGNSTATVPQFLRSQPELRLDLITVDGDHSRRVAAADLRNTLPRLAIGGFLVFDDIALNPGLRELWHTSVRSSRSYATWEYESLGYGVAIALRKS